MVRACIFDYLLILLAPLFTYLFSKIQLFAPRSNYVVVHDTRPSPADLVFSTKNFEMYAPHNLTVALLIGVSVLGLLHLAYFIYAIQQPLTPVNLPWKTEMEAYNGFRDQAAFAKRKSIWSSVTAVVQSQLPELSIGSSSRMRRATVASHTPEPEDIELKVVITPPSDHLRDTMVHRSKAGTSDGRHRGDDDDDSVDDSDWGSVYCKEWVDRPDGNHATGVESWSPT